MNGEIEAIIDDCAPVVVACSGGVDSLLLATLVHRRHPDTTVIAHTVSPAVPAAATARVVTAARERGWDLRLVRSHEFDDEAYRSNPTDRCYHCKTHLYDELSAVAEGLAGAGLDPDHAATIVSGANVDDLGEYRPGLIAADEHDVRHPFVEAGMGKAAIREAAAALGLPEADLPAGPCLASRLYTGTRVTAERLRAVELGESVVQDAGVAVVRCRIREDDVVVEVTDDDRERIDDRLLADVLATMRTAEPGLASVRLDATAYRPGRAVLAVTSS